MSCQTELIKVLPKDQKSETQYLEAIRWLLPPGFIWGFVAQEAPFKIFKDNIVGGGNTTIDDNSTGTGGTITNDNVISQTTPGITASTKFGALFSAIASEIFRFQNRWYDLYRESIPGLSEELLIDWERVAGLPDSCTITDNRTVAERQCAVHSKLFANHYRGLTRQFYIDYAETLGYDLLIQELTSSGIPDILAPVGVDAYNIGMRLGSDYGARFVKKGNQAYVQFTIISGPSDPEQIAYLQCTMDKIKPAHVIITWVL